MTRYKKDFLSNHLDPFLNNLDFFRTRDDNKNRDNVTDSDRQTQSPPSRRWRDGYAAISRYEAKAILT